MAGGTPLRAAVQAVRPPVGGKGARGQARPQLNPSCARRREQSRGPSSALRVHQAPCTWLQDVPDLLPSEAGSINFYIDHRLK